LLLKGFRASILIQSGGDLQEALTLAKEVIEKANVYFEGNEVNEILVDPNIIAASICMRMQLIPEAVKYLNTAESIVKQLSGEMNEKLIDIY
jgi:hypothetical protein